MSGSSSPRTLAEAVALLQREPDRIPMAGCTDLMVGGADPQRSYLDLTRIGELHGIHEAGDRIHIGAATTFAEIRASRTVQKALPILAEAASVVGGWQIQNRATIGGNMVNASPAGDSLPVLLALDARVVIVGAKGERDIPYSEFHVDYRKTALRPGELVTKVLVRVPAPTSVQRFRKVGTRAAQAISKVVVAFGAELDSGRLRAVRLAAGSVAAIPIRLGEAENQCEGAVVDAGLADRVAVAAQDEVQPIDDVRSTAEYRRWVLGRVVRRMVLSLATD